MVYCFESLLFKKFYKLFVFTVAICKIQISEKNKSASGPHSERMCLFSLPHANLEGALSTYRTRMAREGVPPWLGCDRFLPTWQRNLAVL